LVLEIYKTINDFATNKENPKITALVLEIHKIINDFATIKTRNKKIISSMVPVQFEQEHNTKNKNKIKYSLKRDRKIKDFSNQDK